MPSDQTHMHDYIHFALPCKCKTKLVERESGVVKMAGWEETSKKRGGGGIVDDDDDGSDDDDAIPRYNNNNINDDSSSCGPRSIAYLYTVVEHQENHSPHIQKHIGAKGIQESV